MKQKDEIQADYLVAVLMHIFFAMHWQCIGCHSAYFVSCGDSGLGENFFVLPCLLQPYVSFYAVDTGCSFSWANWSKYEPEELLPSSAKAWNMLMLASMPVVQLI
jgi:hypothetical protein